MTKQEMFNRAVRGLRSQNWEQCIDGSNACVYDDGQGRHCAWGWVDPESWGHEGPIGGLRTIGVGIAADLSGEELRFAAELQIAHDNCLGGMEAEFRRLGEQHGLDWPE